VAEVGFINVPISPSFVGIASKLNSQLIQPTRVAGKKAAGEVEKSVEATVKSLGRQVYASTKKLNDLDKAYEDSKGKRELQQKRLNAAIADQTAAEEQYQKALARGESGATQHAKVLKLKAKVTDETLKLKKAEDDVVDAEKKHKAQLDDLNRTMDKQAKAQADLNDNMGKSKGLFGGIRESMKGLGDQVSSMPGPIGNIGEVLTSFKGGPTAGIVAVAGAAATAAGAFGKWNEDLVQSRVSMQNQFGLSADAAREMQGEVAEALGSGLGSYEETSVAVQQISQVLGDNVAHMGGQTAAQLADDFMAFNKTFERSAEETASTVDVMLNSGMVASAQEGVDLLTAGMQKVPAAMQDEVFDATNEYSKFFANMGISGSDAMAMLVKASEQGQYAIDKTGDAVKEFSLKAVDPAVAETLSEYGIQVEDLAGRVARGGPEASAAMNDMVDQLMAIPDEGERATAAIAAFGTPLEDLSVDQIPSFLEGLKVGGDGMGDFSGSAQDMADNTQRTFTGMLNSAKGHIQGWAIDTTLALNNWAGDIGSAIINSNFVEMLTSGFTKAWDFIVSGLGWAKDAILDGWESITGPIGRVASDIKDRVTGAWGDIWKTITTDEFVDGDGALGRLVGSDNAGAILGVIDTVQGAWEEVKSAFTLEGDWGYGALAQLVGADRAEWIVDKLSSIKPAWDEIKAAITGGDWGYGALENLVGTDRAQWVLDQIDAVRDGLFDFRDRLVEGFGQVKDALSPAFEWLHDMVSGQLSGVMDSLKDTFSSLWDSIKAVGEALGGAFGSALEGLISAGKSLWEALKPVAELLVNALMPVLKIVGGIIGGVVVGAVMLFVGGLRLASEIVERFAGVIQWLAENVLAPLIGFLGEVSGFLIEHLAGAIGWVVEKFAELGNYLLESFFPAVQTVMVWVGAAFSAVWDGLQWAWENILQPVFNGIWELVQVTLGVIGTLILAPLLIIWNVWTAAISWAWENIIQPVWQAIADFAQNTLWPVLQSIFQLVGDKWQWLSDMFATIWGVIRDNVLIPLVSYFQETLWPVVESILGWISDKWQWLSDTLTGIWNWVFENIIMAFVRGVEMLWGVISSILGWVVDKWNWLKDTLAAVWGLIDEYVIQAFVRGVQRLWDAVTSILGWIVDKWNWLKDKLWEIWSWIDGYVFAPIGRGLDTVKGWFQAAVDGIGWIWDGLKAAAAKPVKFVIDTVWNNGILKAWNQIAEFLPGIDTKAPVALGELGNYASGGVLPGYTPGRDVHDFYSPTAGRLHLSGGEAIMRPEWVRAVGGAQMVEKMNRAARRGDASEALPSAMETGAARSKYHINPKLAEVHAHYADGGIWRSLWTAASTAFPNATNNSNYRPGDPGHHGYGEALDLGGPMQQIADWIFQTYPQSDQLIWGPGPLILQSGRTGYVPTENQDAVRAAYGPGTMAGHYDHVHWASMKPIESDGKMISAAGMSAGGGFGSIIASKAKGIWDKLVEPIKGWVDEHLSEWGDSAFAKIPGSMLESLREAAWSKVSSLFTSGGNSSSVDVSGISGPVVDQVQQVFAKHGWTGQQWEDAKWIIGRESGWDVSATNPSSGAFGLFQFNPMGGDTLGAYLPDKSTDPAIQGDAGARYIRDRYGDPTAARRFWEANGWYADGGIVDLAKHMGAKLYDVGGTLPHGGIALNASGEDEFILKNSGMRSLGDLARAIGDLVPAVKEQTDALARQADGMQEWMAKAADLTSIEGINARQGVRQVLDLGIDLPGADVVAGFLDAEQDIWDARQRGLKHLDAIAEKEKALADSRKSLADLQSAEAPAADISKVEEAQKKLDDAKAEQAKADADDARAEAAKKVTEAEDNLQKVREETDKKTTEDAQKRADEITKANDDVTKAESELAAARKAQAADLDNIVLMSQESILGLIPQAQGMANQLIGMGAAAGAVNAGLGTVVGALGSVAATAGPAGITLGLALSVAKSVISVITKIVTFIKGIIEKIRAAILDSLESMATGWETVAKHSQLVVEMQTSVSKLQQQLVRGINEQRVAEFALRVATQDRLIAEADGAASVAEAKLALDKQLEKANVAAQLRMMGLFEDWDSYKSFEAMKAQGVLDQWSDAAISALYTYEAARAKALQGEMQARLEQIKSEAALATATRQNLRNQQDLNTAQERLIRLSAKANGVDLGDATATSQVASLVAEMAKLQQEMDKNLVGKAGAALGLDGAFSNQYRGQQAQMASLQAALDAVMQETGVTVSDSQLSKAIDQMKWVSGAGGDAMAVLRALMPELVDAETALKIDEVMKPIDAAKDAQRDAERQVEDFGDEIDLFEKTQPLEELIKGLDYQIKALQSSSTAWADGNEDLRQEHLDVARANEDAARELGLSWKNDTKYGSAAATVEREVTINWNGPGTQEEIQEMVDEILAGSDTKATVRKTASEVAGARRGVMA